MNQLMEVFVSLNGDAIRERDEEEFCLPFYHGEVNRCDKRMGMVLILGRAGQDAVSRHLRRTTYHHVRLESTEILVLMT